MNPFAAPPAAPAPAASAKPARPPPPAASSPAASPTSASSNNPFAQASPWELAVAKLPAALRPFAQASFDPAAYAASTLETRSGAVAAAEARRLHALSEEAAQGAADAVARSAPAFVAATQSIGTVGAKLTAARSAVAAVDLSLRVRQSAAAAAAAAASSAAPALARRSPASSTGPAAGPDEARLEELRELIVEREFAAAAALIAEAPQHANPATAEGGGAADALAKALLAEDGRHAEDVDPDAAAAADAPHWAHMLADDGGGDATSAALLLRLGRLPDAARAHCRVSGRRVKRARLDAPVAALAEVAAALAEFEALAETVGAALDPRSALLLTEWAWGEAAAVGAAVAASCLAAAAGGGPEAAPAPAARRASVVAPATPTGKPADDEAAPPPPPPPPAPRGLAFVAGVVADARAAALEAEAAAGVPLLGPLDAALSAALPACLAAAAAAAAKRVGAAVAADDWQAAHRRPGALPLTPRSRRPSSWKQEGRLWEKSSPDDSLLTSSGLVLCNELAALLVDGGACLEGVAGGGAVAESGAVLLAAYKDAVARAGLGEAAGAAVARLVAELEGRLGVEDD